jgi:hypothetical protein
VPTGVSPSERGGVIDPTDLRGAGPMEWESMVGIAPSHPLVTGGGELNDNINERWSRVVTQPYSQSGPASDTIATPDGTSTGMGNWRDVFNFHGSAVPYLLVMVIAIVYFSHLKLSAKGSTGGFGKHVSAGAALN